LLQQILDAVKHGNEIGTNNGAVLNQILEQMGKYEGDSAEIKTLLQQILDKVTQGVEENKDMDTKTNQLLQAILAKINCMDDKNAAALKKIIALITEGNTIGTNNGAVLNQILNALGSLNGNDDSAIRALLQQILDKVTQGVETGSDIYTLLQNMDATNKDFYLAILDKLDSLDNSQQASLNKILQAIQDNTKVAKGTQSLVQKILENLGKLGNKADAILDAISKISVGDKVDLSAIEQMLADLLDQTKKNGEVLTDIDSKLSLVSVTLTGLANQIGSGHEAILAKLNEILAKIPDGCKCTNVDLTVIINKLDQLIESVKTNPNDDKTHEGILDDLDSLLG
jgi:hypothetical protein